MIEQLKADFHSFRLQDNIKAAILKNMLSVLISDAERGAMGPKGKQIPSNEIVISLIRKFIESAKEMNSRSTNAMTTNIAKTEIDYLTSKLPKQLGRGEIFDIIHRIPHNEPFTMSSLMKYFKDNYPSQYDGKELNQIVKDILAK